MRILLTIAFLVAAACQGNLSTSNANIQVAEALRFPHVLHTELPCQSCHVDPGPGTARPSRPGQNAHESCRVGGCHARDFQGEPTLLCGLCHESLEAPAGAVPPLVPYPPRAGPRTEAVSFSHRRHLDAERMERQLGFHISCTDCHPVASQDDASSAEIQSGSELPRPSHAACARCHAVEAAVPGSPTMAACGECHQAGSERRRQRSFITGDLHFHHSIHRNDRRGTRIGCATCHTSTAQSDDSQRLDSKLQMQVCVSCHNDDNRVPPTKRMSRCETCHATRSAGLSALAPRSHMPATDRPANHTQAFRRNHATDADRPDADCARCHTMVSGNRRNTCDECHQVMEPQDHVITWREYDHGPQAATDADRCVTCHQVDFCTTCHTQRPRSHFPSEHFRIGGHGTQAVLNLRACLTCHQPDRDCSGSGCHRGDLL